MLKSLLFASLLSISWSIPAHSVTSEKSASSFKVIFHFLGKNPPLLVEQLKAKLTESNSGISIESTKLEGPAVRTVPVDIGSLTGEEAKAFLRKVIEDNSRCDLLIDDAEIKSCIESAELSADLFNDNNWLSSAQNKKKIRITGVGIGGKISSIDSEQLTLLGAAVKAVELEQEDENAIDYLSFKIR